MKNIKLNLKEKTSPFESLFENKEDNYYTSVNIKRTSSFCKEVFNISENKEDICKSLNTSFTY
jgi:hypothetical protein